MMGGTVKEITKDFENEENQKNEGIKTPSNNSNNNKKKHTGAKVAIATISMVALLGLAATVGVDYVSGAKETYYETKRAEQLVEFNSNNGNICVIPEQIATNNSYDTKYCEGEQLVSELNENGIKYCEILDEYYTPEGKNIAILTYEVVTTEVIDAQKVEMNGTTIYMAPEGYTLQGNKCVKETVKNITKIVEAMDKENYKNIVIDGVTSYKLVDITEVSTKKYSEIASKTLICDVADTPILNEEGRYNAKLVLVPKTK